MGVKPIEFNQLVDFRGDNAAVRESEGRELSKEGVETTQVEIWYKVVRSAHSTSSPLFEHDSYFVEFYENWMRYRARSRN